MDYKDYIEEARKYLSDTDDRESYRKYYEDAMNGIRSGYADSVSELEKAYRSSLNEAAANSDIQAKNNAKFMASRGLSRSGEAEQENVLRSLSLNAEAERLAGQKASKQTELRQNAENAVLELEKERAKYEDSERKRLDDNAFAIAKVQYSADREDEQNALEDRRKEDERRYTESLTRLKAELAEAAAEKEREFKASEDAKKREYDSAEAEKKRSFESSESAKKREYDSAEAEKKRTFESSESAKKREYDSAEAEKKRTFESSESAKKREYEASESAKKREYEASESTKKREYEASESAKKREQESEILKTKLEHEDKLKTGQTAEKETGKANDKANNKTVENASGETVRQNSETAAVKDESTSSKGSYEPKQTAASLAKQAVKSLTINGTVNGLADRLGLNKYIDGLRAEGSLSEQYIKDIETALGAYGYKKPDQTEIDAGKIFDNLTSVYDKAYKNALESYKRIGAGAGTAPKLAGDYAVQTMLSYIYDNSKSDAQIDMVCELAGIDKSMMTAFLKEYGLKSIDGADKNGAGGAEEAGAGGGKSSGGKRTLPGDTVIAKY